MALDGLHAAGLTHGSCGEVGVGSSAVPVSGHGLGVEGHHDSEIFGDSLEDISGDPEVITHVDSLSGTDLILPLCRHDLGICTGHPDAGIQAGSVVSLNNIATVNTVGTNTAVVGTLGSGEPVLGPSEGMSVLSQEGVLLLNAEPGLGRLSSLHDLQADLPVVGVCGLLVVLVGFTHHHDVVSTSEWIRVDLDGVKVGVGVLSLSLVG